MALPLVSDPFDLEALGLASPDLPDRLMLDSDVSPQLIHGGLLPHAGRAGRWELPAAVGRYAGNRDRLQLRLSGFPSEVLTREPELPLPSVAERIVRLGQTVIGESDRPELDTLQLFDALQFHGDALHRFFERAGFDPAVIEAPGVAWCPSHVLLEELREANERRTPPIATIVKVQMKLEEPLRELIGALRRLLRRRRRMVPVAIAEQVDAGCVQWLARQPGRELREWAGSKQEILAVVREETVDTFENRVLKACLQLCASEAGRYVHIYGERFGGHMRVEAVRRFRRLVAEFLRIEEFESVGQLGDDSRPNYVLQFEHRYRVVWWAYLQLKQRKQAEDELWKWRHRVWSEIVITDLAIAATGLAGWDASRLDRELGVLRDPIRGYWLSSGSRFPCFTVTLMEKAFHVAFDLPMHAPQPTAPHELPLADLRLTIESTSAHSKVLEAHIVACASFLPPAAPRTEGSMVLVMHPDTADLRAKVDVDPSLFAQSGGLVPWPTWGPNRIQAAGSVLTQLIGKVENN